MAEPRGAGEADAAASGPAGRVLLAASLVPPGRVVSYGDIAALVGIGPRQVGAIMRDHGASVPWWRVVGHDGVLQPLDRALGRWASEGIAVRPDGRGCRMRDHRADLTAWAAEFHAAVATRGA